MKIIKEHVAFSVLESNAIKELLEQYAIDVDDKVRFDSFLRSLSHAKDVIDVENALDFYDYVDKSFIRNSYLLTKLVDDLIEIMSMSKL